MRMKILLFVTAVIEIGAGLALVALPSLMVKLLLGSPLDMPAALIVARLAGVALFVLGFSCWLARLDVQSRAARGLVVAMVLYNFGVVVILGAAGVWPQLVGVALWPAVVLHAAMAVWCIACLRSKCIM